MSSQSSFFGMRRQQRAQAAKPTEDETQKALKAWGVLYGSQLKLPKPNRTDDRSLSQLSTEELFSIPAPDPSATAREMVAEAAFIGRESLEQKG